MVAIHATLCIFPPFQSHVSSFHDLNLCSFWSKWGDLTILTGLTFLNVHTKGKNLIKASLYLKFISQLVKSFAVLS